MEIFTKANDHEKCQLRGTEVCRIMNNPPCPACEIGKLSDDRQKEIQEDYETVLELLPEGGVAPFYESETCLLCKNEPKGKREYYGIVDFAHVQPQRTKASVIGIKVKARVGSLIPVQIASCGKCRKNMVLGEYLQWIIVMLVAIIALVCLSVNEIREPLIGINELLPLGVFGGLILISAVAGQLITNAFVKAKAKETVMDINELERVQALREKGWFTLSDDKRSVRLLFSKKPMARGWFTPAPGKPQADNARQG